MIDVILWVLSTLICVLVAINKETPWIAVAIYWAVLSLKYFFGDRLK